MPDTDSGALESALRGLLTTVDAAEALLPQEGRSQMLALVVRTAARVLHANAASLFLIDESGKDLVFEVAIGPKAEEVSQFRVPIGHGIAGVVAATGQPMAISAPEQDPRFAAEIARTVGYMPQSILCVPLRYGDTIIGVLEVLDKAGRDSFTPDDIEVLAYFAELAAQATDHVRRRDDLRNVLAEIIAAWGRGDRAAGKAEALMAEIDRVLAQTRSTPEYQDALEIARAVAEVARTGEAERALAYDWLRRLHRYLRGRTHSFSDVRPWSV